MGLYASVEDRWYSFWEKTPLIGAIDAIDSAIPSLILFIILLIFLIAGGTYFLFIQNPFVSGVNLSVTVLDKAQNPIQGANVEYTQNCDNTPGNNNLFKTEISTNASGKANFSVCPNALAVGLYVTKEKYVAATAEILLNAERQKIVNLSRIPNPRINANVKVTDEENNIIPAAKLEFSCIKNGSPTNTGILSISGGQTQSENGFLLDFDAECDNMNLIATAPGYEDKTESISISDTQKNIKLSKITQTGTADFIADSPIGKQGHAEITINDYLGTTQTLLTLGNGEISQELASGTYTYSAEAMGFVKTGSFTVLADTVIDVPIYFGGIVGPDTNTLNVYLKPVDNNSNPIQMGQARIFYESQNDTNFFRSVESSISGLIGPVQIAETNGKTYKAIVSATGYAKKIVLLEIKTAAALPQIVPLDKGGWNLTVRVMDDQNHPVANAVTKIFSQGFGGALTDARATDADGLIIFDGLANGNYSVNTQTETTIGAGNATISDGDKSLIIQVNTGTGTLNLNFISNKLPVSPKFFAQKKTDSGFERMGASAYTASKSVKVTAGSQINFIVDDEGYLPFESFVYTTTRETAGRNIYLMKQNDLPNKNPVQMILRKALKSDPTTVSESAADVLASGNTYYLLFDLIFNTQSRGSALVNSYFDGNGEIFFQGAKSIDGASVQMSSKKQGQLIDSDYVNSNAKQANILISDIGGPKSIPVLLKISVDENAKIGSKKTIYWQASLDNEQSILYSKEFTIGSAFCFTDCPSILFSSFIMNQSNANNPNWEVADDSKINQIQLGDNYKIKTNAVNLTDNDFASAQLALGMDTAGKNYLSFDNNSSTANTTVNFGPLATTADLVSTLKPLSATTGVAVNRGLTSASSSTLSSAPGNDSKIRFSIKNKNSLNIEISNGNDSAISEKVAYPVFVVSTYTKETANGSKTYGPAYWKATLKRGTTSFVLYSGRSTNENGMDTLPFDATGLNAGDIVAFDAWNEQNSAPVHLEITVTNPFNSQLAAPDCINVSFISNNERINAKDMPVPFFELDIKSNGTIFIGSSCPENRKIKISSALHFSPLGTDFTISPGTEQAINVDCQNTQDQCQTLGAFPVTIYSGASQPTNLVAAIDVVLKDSGSPLDLSTAIWDFSKAKAIVGKVTNKVYQGRKDYSLPLMEINKPGVQIDYFKPGAPQGTGNGLGVPQKINFKLKVDTIGLEGITYGQIIGEAFQASYKDCDGTGKAFVPLESNGHCYTSTPDNPCTLPPYNFTTAGNGTALCRAVVQKFTDASSNLITVPYSAIRDPSKTFDQLTPQERAEIISEITGQPVPAGSLAEEKKESGIQFAAAPPTLALPPAPYMTEGDSSAAIGTKSFAYMQWWDLPEPIGMDYNKWFYYADYTTGRFSPQNLLGGAHSASAWANGFGYHGLGVLGGTIGIDWSYLKFHPDGTCEGFVNFDSQFIDVKTPINERDFTWSKDVEIDTVKGKVVDLGSYDTSMAPLLWGNQNLKIVTYNSSTMPDKWETNNSDTGYNYSCMNKVSDVLKCRISINSPTTANSAQSIIACNNSITALDCENHLVYPIESAGRDPDTNRLICNSSKFDSLKNNPQCKQIQLPIRALAAYGYYSGQILCENSLGYVTFDSVKDYNYPLPSVNSPLVEFNNGGKAYSTIKKENIPDGVRLFLKDGHVYAEYIGVYKDNNGLIIDPPTATSPDIDFKVTKTDGLKSGYATLTVSDWAGNDKVSKKFSVKLIGGETNCQSLGGEEGISGAGADLHLLYDWDFGSILDNQCESSNLSYSYCDGTQFMVMLVKKFDKILSAEQNGDSAMIAKQSSGYFYLIKDNYSQNLLKDFDTYYSKFLSGYIQLRDRTGFDKLAAAGRIKFVVHNNGTALNGGALPNGGIYFVGIDIAYDNPSNKNFVNLDGTSNATITVNLTPYLETGSQNPLYEMPFDGEVGKNSTGNYARADYGVGASAAFELNLKNNLSPVASAGLKSINVEKNSDLTELSNGVVLAYNSNNIVFSPSQPTPVMMTIKGDGNGFTAGYSLTSSGNDTFPIKYWTKKGSTMENGCYDFAGQNKSIYGETVSGNNYTFSWPNGTSAGTLYLASTFYSPSSNNGTAAEISPLDPRTTVLSSIPGVNGLKNGASLMLKYYDAAPSAPKDYATLQGMVSLIKKGDMCISKNLIAGMIKVWWNPSTISKLEAGLDTQNAGQCAVN